MIQDLMASRRSVRQFRPEPPGRDVIERLLRAAIAAPSASNQQPWRFIAITHRPTIASLARAVRESIDRLVPSVPPEAREPLRRYGAYFSGFGGAPVVIVALWRPMQLLSSLVGDAAPAAQTARMATLEENSALMGASLAIGNLLLAAHAEGLGACCMTGPMLAEDDLRALLPIQPSWRLAAFVPVGFPAEVPPPTPRKPLERVLTWIDDERSERGP
jgi:nitroreductase